MITEELRRMDIRDIYEIQPLNWDMAEKTASWLEKEDGRAEKAFTCGILCMAAVYLAGSILRAIFQ
ncbi:MAG: hypothetical protein ACOY31_03145 [Bacillota bacterium]